MRLTFTSLVALLIAGSANAQDTFTRTEVGPYVNYQGRSNGEEFFFVESQVGPVHNLQGHIGGRQVYCTSYSIGPYSNTKCH
jgi:hypothetical protein